MLYFAGGYPGVSFPPPALADIRPPVPVAVHLVIEIPMLMRTRDTTRQTLIQRRADLTMQMVRQITVAMSRGMSERAELPMRVLTIAQLERT